MARYNWIALVVLGSLGPAWAINQELGTRTLVQPDGTRFSVREYIDEFGHYLAADAGYVVQDATTGYYYYARYDSAGKATPSSLRVGRDDASSDVARLAEENYQALIEMARRRRGGGAVTGSAITLPESLLVILVEFSDVKHQNPDDWPMEGLTGGNKDDGDDDTEDYPEYRVSDFEAMLFGENYTRSPDSEMAYGSMRQYYEDMSKQRETDTPYTLKGRVVNQVRADNSGIPIWVTLGRTKSYFNRPGGEDTDESTAKGSFRDAVLAAADSQQGIDTTTSATRKLCIIYAGNKYYNGGLHPHYNENLYIMSERTANLFSVEKNSANFSHIGTHCHEFGHVLGLGDHYCEPRSYRHWGLMANGGHKGKGANPSPLVPHHRAGLGWLTPTEVTGFMENETLSYSSYQNDVYRIRSSSDSNDFFLIENRQADEGWNKGLKDGLLIWHIKDVSGLFSDWIDLIEANGLPNGPYAGDPFPGSTGNRNLTDFTSPSSKRWGPTPLERILQPDRRRENSNVLVTNISASGMEMTADLSPFWVGTIAENTTWSGTVRVGGDLTIPVGVTLTIEANSVIQFLADTDAAAGGTDTGRSELIVQGTLNASAGMITFRSTNDDPSDAEWYGIRVLSGGSADLSNASLHDGVLCVSNTGGTVTRNSQTTFKNCGDPGPNPVLAGAATPLVNENIDPSATGPVAVGVYRNTDPNPNAPVWSLIGADASTFRLVQTSGNAGNERTLQFRAPPNYEVPLAGGGYKTTYKVGVVVRDVWSQQKCRRGNECAGVWAAIGDSDGRVWPDSSGLAVGGVGDGLRCAGAGQTLRWGDLADSVVVSGDQQPRPAPQ